MKKVTNQNSDFNNSLLVKIYCSYKITWKNYKHPTCLILMENIENLGKILRKYDLKGSTHRRLEPMDDLDNLKDLNFDRRGEKIYISLSEIHG